MSVDERHGSVSRRAVIRVAAGSAILLPGLMAACSAPAPSAPAARPTAGTAAGAASTAKPASALPSYIPVEVGPKPDYVSAGPQYEHGWEDYPTDRFKAWTKAPPGGLNVTLGQQGTANLPVFLQQKCADLTPYLAGAESCQRR
jgi:hypothetical protein